MPMENLTTFLGIPGFKVVDTMQRKRGWRSQVILSLERERGFRFRCSGCDQEVAEVTRYRKRWVRHLFMWQHATFLRFEQYRVICPRCGLKVEALPWLARYERVTMPLAALVAELCKVMTNKAVGRLMELHTGTVKTIDKAAMQKAQAERSLDGITVLGTDEIAVGKGQTYWHLISGMDGPRGPELLYIGEGRKEKDLEPFWKWFGPERTARITHGVMDMWKGFIHSFRAHVPGIVLIFDKFHILRHLSEALNKVRKQEFVKAKGRFRGLLAGKKFVLLARKAHVRGKAREALKDVLSFSKKLARAHLLKESFVHLWSYRSKTCARRFFTEWVKELRWKRLKPYEKFSRMVEKHFDGILACCDKRVKLGYIEATNLHARNIIRRAYGYRDKEYMKLKILQACSSLGAFRPWNPSFNIPP
ncbi:MAG: ISL3 family transposase [Elusimicrobia bacterium]|nr:ISL3 family transposase [Elusimicrobiota bacterium]